MSFMALWSFGLICLCLKCFVNVASSSSSSSSDDYHSNIAANFGSNELQSLRDEIETKILANDDGLTADSDLVDALDLVAPFDLVLIASFVRLAFHDCAGSPSGSHGKCDGCIDITNEDNGGLYEGAMLPLQSICNDYNEEYDLSFADCWALAATFAIEIGQERADSDWELFAQRFSLASEAPSQTIFSGDIPYFVGRKDNCDCGDYGVGDSSLNEEFPNAKLGWQHGSEYMSEKFPDLTYKEIVALISGGHSLGRAHGKISGFTGAWDVSRNLVDNEYHRELTMTTDRFNIFLNWQSGKLWYDDNANSQFFVHGDWVSLGLPQNDLALMLNVDMELVYDLSDYIDNDLLDDIDCSANAIKYCELYEPDSTVLYPGDDKEDGLTYCSFRQCPIQCNNDDTLNEYKNNGYSNIPNNGDCPAAWMWQFSEDNENLGETFAAAFTKMITQGYNINKDLKQLYL